MTMKYLFYLSALICLLMSCEQEKTLSKSQENLYGLPRDWTVDVLFDEQDSIQINDSTKRLTKNNHDMVLYLPIKNSSNHGHLIVSHETIQIDSVYGDGGGATMFEVKKEGIQWNVIGKKHAINFDQVNQTALNCGGTLTPNGTVLLLSLIHI